MDKQAIQDLQTCMNDFDADPFPTMLPTLRSLQHCFVATAESVEAFKAALKDGQTLVDILLQEKVFSKSTSLTKIVHRNKRKNFANVQISALSQMEGLAQGSGMIQLEAAVERRLTEE